MPTHFCASLPLLVQDLQRYKRGYRLILDNYTRHILVRSTRKVFHRLQYNPLLIHLSYIQHWYSVRHVIMSCLKRA